MNKETLKSEAMTAEQMFAELGYTKCLKLDWAIFFDDYYNEIAFYFDAKAFIKHDDELSVDITVEELKAINKQCKELGWL